MSDAQPSPLPCVSAQHESAAQDGLCTAEARRIIRRTRRDGDCWLWAGAVDPRFGYARTGLNGVRMGVHVAMYVLCVGPVPDGYQVDHVRERCHPDKRLRRTCCNPAHLEAVTREENMRRMRHDREAARDWSATHCKHGHEWTEDNTYIEPEQDKRRCRTCYRIGTQVRRQNRKAAAANTRTESLDALAEATATHLRMLGRWQPGTLSVLLAPSSLPGARRVDQLLGGAP